MILCTGVMVVLVRYLLAMMLSQLSLAAALSYPTIPYVIAQFFQPRVLTAIVAVYGGVLVGKLVGLQSTS